MKQKIKVGDLYVDCGCHPVRCTESDGDDLAGVSLADGSTPRSCSVKHCDPKKITQKQADEYAAAWKKDGERGLMRVAGFTQDQINYFMENYRSA